MEGEGEVKGGADVEFAKVESKVWKEERGNEESTKKKEATRSLERGDEQKALTRVAGRLPPCQPYISSSRYYSKYPYIYYWMGIEPYIPIYCVFGPKSAPSFGQKQLGGRRDPPIDGICLKFFSIYFDYLPKELYITFMVCNIGVYNYMIHQIPISSTE